MADETNIYGIRYEVDIESLKKSTADAGKQIKLANAEFNESSSKLDDWGSSTEGVSAKIKQMNAILEAEKSKLAQSQKSYNDNADSIDKYASQIDELKQKKKQAIDTYGAESTEVQQLTTQINKLSREQTVSINSADKLKVAIANQQATVNRTEKSLEGYEGQLKEVQEAQKRAEKSGNSLEAELKDMRKASDETTESTKKMGGGFTVVKGAIAGLIATGISSMISGLRNASEETKEYRTELGKLKATAQTTGASFDNAKKNLKEVASITSDTGAGVEGLNNILSAGFDGKLLDEITDQLLGASIKWKDTLKFEGLADGLQETLASGKAIGPFSELIERAGGSLEVFDEGLTKAIASGTQQQYVLDFLAKYGLKDVKNAYEENNKSLIDSANATFDFNDRMAQMGKKTEPIVNSVKKGFIGLFDEIVNGSDSMDVEGFTDDIDNAFSIARDGISWVKKNIKPLTSLVLGMGTAWLSYKTAVAGSNAVTSITNTLMKLKTAGTVADTTATVAGTTATNGATIATKALALAQKMTPWGLVAGAIAGVVVGLIAFTSSSNKSKGATDENTIATDKLIKKQKELNDSLKEGKKEREGSITSAKEQTATADILHKKIQELSEVEGKSNSQKAEMKALVEKLNETMPELNLQYDQEKDRLNMSTEAIRNNINAQKDLILAKASQENMMKIAEEMAEVEVQQASLIEQRTKNEKEYAKAKEKTIKAYKDFEEAGSNVGSQEHWNWVKTSQYEADKKTAFEKTKDAVEKNEKSLNKLNKEYDKTSEFAQNKLDSAEIDKQLSAITEKARASGVEVPQAISKGISEGKYAVPQSVEEMQALISFESLKKKAKENGVSIPKSLSEGIKNGSIAPSEAVKQMNSLVSFSGLLNESSIAGKKVPNSIREGIVSGKLSPQQAIIEMNNLMSVEMDKQPAKAKAKGQQTGKGYADGVGDNTENARASGSRVGYASTLGTGQGASGMFGSGANAGSNFNSGLEGSKGASKTAGEKVGQKGVDGAKSKYNDYYGAGGYLTGGINSGVSDNSYSVYTSMSNLAWNMIDNFKKNLKIKSPSRIFIALASFIPKGIRKGIVDNQGMVVNAVEKMVDKVAEAGKELKNAIALDDMNASLNTSVKRIGNHGSKLAAAGAGGNSNVNSVTFNQYNTSPKALDSLEVFRNTQKQMKLLKTWKGEN